MSTVLCDPNINTEQSTAVKVQHVKSWQKPGEQPNHHQGLLIATQQMTNPSTLTESSEMKLIFMPLQLTFVPSNYTRLKQNNSFLNRHQC